MHLTTEVFKTLFGNASVSFAEPLDRLMREYKINTVERIACFLAQTGHECQEYTRFEENLNYSSEGLTQVFSKYFDQNSAVIYHGQPKMIANKVYANRMGNGDEASGDGWKYHGRGIIQLTGKNNYVAFNKRYGSDSANYEENPDLILTSPLVTCLTGFWFWNKHNLNEYADEGAFELITRKINGGLNGLPHRLELYTKAKELLKHESTEPWEKYNVN